MRLPEELARLLAGRPVPGGREQAFPFLTVDEAGYPHVALLSRAELGVGPAQATVLAVVASRRTRQNLARDRRASLIAISGTTAHYAKLRVVRTVEAGGLLGCELEVAEHKADSIGIPLSPVRFTATAELAAAENWELSEAVLRTLEGT
jgi:hypothetical protein